MCHFFMAIPFNLPSDEETEENYRRMDQLLADLYSVLRQILLRPRYNPQPARESRQTNQPEGHVSGSNPPGGGDTGERRIPNLPDLVLDSLPSHSSPSPCVGHSETCSNRTATTPSPSSSLQPRQSVRRRRRRQFRCCHRRSQLSSSVCVPEVTRARPQESWVMVGEELRKIAEDFRSSCTKKEAVKKSEDNLKVELKTSCLFSLLVPAPFGGSIWTTVVLLVGWSILMRQQ